MAPPPGPFMPQPQPRNGLGIAGLVLGIVGAVFFWTVWGGIILGVLGLIFGLIGRSRARKGEATNGGVALAGAILGGLAIVASVVWLIFVVVLVQDTVDEINNELDKAKDGTSSSAPQDPAEDATDSGEPATDAPADDEPAVFGDSYEWEDGVTITVSEPKAYTPDQYAAGHAKGNKAFQFTVTVENGSKEKLDGAGIYPSLRDGKGAEAELVFDGSNGTKLIEGTILPGKKAVATYAFSIPAGAEKELQMEISPDLIEYDNAIWTGSAK
ncbi:DUF4190 and DUF4352 domain-containing protein [Streptomyces sp. TRM66268-LWL]|uniref:DUF4190 and DUF4352 domain-containing protein n=2 Tax=Streptomyces polyasparticus TaxID=2767826 RepID=A0ABR7SDI6_9ACTN|nr:DUF4190 and DUF4352 domain-containing protein [Streptomyces polyasparticus]